MIPDSYTIQTPIDEILIPTKTYKIDTVNNRISGFVDDLEAMKQAVYLILNSERFLHVIYSWDYGIELMSLYGKPMPYVISELTRRITEALTEDDRISSVTDFNFEREGNKIHITFVVTTDKGRIQSELEVEV